jgi:hypothetical protein
MGNGNLATVATDASKSRHRSKTSPRVPPPGGKEPHWVSRVRDRGGVAVDDVKLEYLVFTPPGGGRLERPNRLHRDNNHPGRTSR